MAVYDEIKDEMNIDPNQAMTMDPVCGMTVDRTQAAAQSGYQGQTYYFCSQMCKKQFDQEPQRYMAPKSGV